MPAPCQPPQGPGSTAIPPDPTGPADRLPVPRIDGDWWRIAAPPTLEQWHRPGVETVDFTVYQAQDGTWQLVACLRGTAHPGAGRLFYRWEAGEITARDWRPQGIFRTTSAELGQPAGLLQAPHCVIDRGRWWMFHNADGAYALVSDDGKGFRQALARDRQPVFFAMGRDVMMFDNRARDGLWYAFFTDITPGRNLERKSNTIAFRTAPDLPGPWSADRTEIGVSTPFRGPGDPYPFAEAESPFVVYRDGRYYRWEQMWVFASRDLARWPDEPVAKLTPDQRDYLAPEIVGTPAGDFIAAYREYGRQGIWMAKLAWG